jgi:hypothetical protein
MGSVSDAKTEFRAKQWNEIIQARQSSGIPIKTWCKQNNISETAYYYWLRRIRTNACQSGSLAIAKVDSQPIVPVASRPTRAPVPITIHLPSISIDINDGASRETIEAVLAALKIIC